MNAELQQEKIYSISLQDKPRGYKIQITKYPVSQEVARKFYFQFISLWWKKVKFKTTEGETVEGYLNGVNGEFKD